MKRRSCNLEKDVSNTSEDYSIGAALGGDPARAANAEGLPKADAPLWLEVPPVERVVLEVFFGKFLVKKVSYSFVAHGRDCRLLTKPGGILINWPYSSPTMLEPSSYS